MASFYKEGDKIQFEKLKGVIIKITETYRKNVLVVKLTGSRNKYVKGMTNVHTIGLFEYPTGQLEFMTIID